MNSNINPMYFSLQNNSQQWNAHFLQSCYSFFPLQNFYASHPPNEFYNPQQRFQPLNKQANGVKEEEKTEGKVKVNKFQLQKQKKIERQRIRQNKIKMEEENIRQSCREPPKVNHKVIYFCVSHSPLVTSPESYLIQREDSKKTIEKVKQEENIENFPQTQENPFIILKDNKTKKKYLKLLKMEKQSSFSQSESQKMEEYQNQSFPNIRRNSRTEHILSHDQ